MGQQIMLYGSLLDQKYECIQEALSRARDKLEILRTEAEMLSAVWQGEAKEEWKRGFDELLTELSKETESAGKYLANLKEQARLLAKAEREMMAVTEELL